MASAEAWKEPYRVNEFIVQIGGKDSPTVSKVSGLNLGETDTVEVPEGGTNVVHKMSSGVVKFKSLTIERYVDGSPDDADFKSFFLEMFNIKGQPGTPTRGIGSGARRDIAIIKKQFGEEKIRFMVYGAWIKSLSFSDLDASANTALKQTVVLEHEGMEWV